MIGLLSGLSFTQTFEITRGKLVCLFVCLSSHSWIFSLIWSRHHCRWRAANFDLCSAQMAIQHWGSLVCHTYYDTGLPLKIVSSEDPWHTHLLLAVDLSLPVFTTVATGDRTPNSAHEAIAQPLCYRCGYGKLVKWDDKINEKYCESVSWTFWSSCNGNKDIIFSFTFIIHPHILLLFSLIIKTCILL